MSDDAPAGKSGDGEERVGEPPAQEAASPAEADSDGNIGRRRAINLVLGGSLAGWLGAVLYPVLVYLKPLSHARDPDEVQLNAKEIKRLGDNNFVIVRFGEARVIVLRDAKGKLRALSAKCTHEGCTVQYRSAERLVWCACHNAKFETSGRVISGPAPKPLTRYAVRETEGGKQVVVSKQS